ncbi:MAG: ABA4-like family protein [Xanthobacteraceae bacterium]
MEEEMIPIAIFGPANWFAMLGWLVLIAGIILNRAWLRDKLAGLYWPLALSAGYCVAIYLGFGQSGGGFDSLPAVRQLFSNDWALLAGWVHYLAFDLFVGAWIARDASRSGVSRWFMIPVLPLTFLFGPAGLLLFQGIKAVFGKGAQS